MSDIIIGTMCLCVGLAIGKWLEALRWRQNAQVIFRIASGGRLYKVTDQTPWDPRPAPGEVDDE